MSRDDSPTPIADRLFEEGFAFDFFQAVRLLQALDPGRAPVGHGGPPQAEAVRFRAHASLGFPPSSIHDLRPAAADDRPPELVQSVLGLTGPNGVLPRHYTELLLRLNVDRQVAERHALRDWLDLFNHRMASLFYRAWAKYRPFLGRERRRPDGHDPGPDAYTRGLLSFVGLGTPGLQGRLAVAPPAAGDPPARRARARVDDLAVVHFAGLFAQRPRSAVGLRAILHDYFGLGVEILQFQGRWLPLEPASQSRLAGGRGASNQLGGDVVIGERVWDVQGSFQVRLGPLTYAQFRSFLPDRDRGTAAFLLAHLVRLYVGPELDFDLRLVLKAAEVPPCQLPAGAAGSFVLGWDCWLAGPPRADDPDDAVFADAELVARDCRGDRGDLS